MLSLLCRKLLHGTWEMEVVSSCASIRHFYSIKCPVLSLCHRQILAADKELVWWSTLQGEKWGGDTFRAYCSGERCRAGVCSFSYSFPTYYGPLSYQVLVLSVNDLVNYSGAYLIIGQPSFFLSPMHDRVWDGNIVQGLSTCGQGLLPHDLWPLPLHN